ncbi:MULTISPECIES: hypothetical protein [unclassified Polaromonas]|uniref:hypothetical protein n=1 Tax=unclassified Polaromonas TaxID=2638319 RepID=UPI000F082E57|nr:MULTISPECIES: hypothetical protein [unclassified Polaromonas]AYQ26871.1 hypothetical protein DT070_01770 [Polaromonas sp. SP1]QGJ18282.1 hypothetical protein F7R28_07665 [Polaromonas sp. Pch-P]
MQPDIPEKMNANTGLCAWGLPVSSCRPQSCRPQPAPTLKVTFQALDIFSQRSKLRSTFTPGMPGLF